MKVELLVFANSKKNNGRCLAGIDVATGRWIRPVWNSPKGELPNDRTIFGSERIRPGDLVRIEVGQTGGSIHHPEDLPFASSEIELVSKNYWKSRLDLVLSEVQRDNQLLRTSEDRISALEVQENGVQNSLALVYAYDLKFKDRIDYFGKRHARLSFRAGQKWWDLTNTDDWGSWQGDFRSGILCISLGDEFKGDHYKLACGFVEADSRDVTGIEPEFLEDVVHKNYGNAPVPDPDTSFPGAGWFMQGETSLPCLGCKNPKIAVFRRHDRPRGDDKTTHGWAFFCVSCLHAYDDLSLRQKVRALKETFVAVERECPDCQGIAAL